MTFLSAAQSVEDSEPRELVVISINDDSTVYRHTSATRDIVYDGVLYTAIAIDRGEIAVTMPAVENDMILMLPIDHAVVRRYCQAGIPPKRVTVTVYRQDGGETEIIWVGDVTSMNAEGRVAKFRVPSRAGEWMLRPLPGVTAGRECGHLLYDTGCGVSRSGEGPTGTDHLIASTVIYANGRDVRVDLGHVARNGTWAENGELLHLDSGERMTISLQTDLNPGVSGVADLRMQMQIVGLSVGDTVWVFAGCDHSIEECRTKFDNKDRFLGFPQLPTKNPFIPAGYGAGGNT